MPARPERQAGLGNVTPNGAQGTTAQPHRPLPGAIPGFPRGSPTLGALCRVVMEFSISQVKHPLYAFRRHGRCAGRRFQQQVIALPHKAAFSGLRICRPGSRGQKADQFFLLFRWQRLCGGFNFSQCAHCKDYNIPVSLRQAAQ